MHTSTVSRALSPVTRHQISDEIARRIDGVAKELGYTRNAIAPQPAHPPVDDGGRPDT